MISIRAPSRLHFGLLGLDDVTPWPNRAGLPALSGRAFGGVGLMIDQPGTWLTVTAAPQWGADGPSAARVLAFAQAYAAAVRRDHAGAALPCHHFTIRQTGPEHAGLGSGTQLGLATARTLARAWNLDDSAAVLARQVGRGLRSALGVHGFERGGFLVEAGKRAPDDLAPLVAHAPFPDAWRIVVVVPARAIGMHEAPERAAFRRLLQQGTARQQTEALCRLVLLGLLPAIAECDWPTFGEALHDFNARSGELFASVQGGVYGGPLVAELVAFIRSQGVAGVGQSSWGPAVFAVTADEDHAADLAQKVREHFALTTAETFVTAACNHGAVIS